jgi:phosphoserine phosphatase RsbU/P
MLDDHTVVFMIADVSGKGIPAALFMMTAKATIKDMAERGYPANKVLEAANDKLCEGNETGMFVTACVGILDLRTGKLQMANAGHNPPLVKHSGGSFEYLKLKPGFVLAGMEGMHYRLNEYGLHAGDRIFLYTDGVTEATNGDKCLYGEERLKAFMNAHADLPAKDLIHNLKDDIDLFVGDAPQFDDITMLMFDYCGGTAMEEKKTFPADVNALPDVQSFFEGALEKVACPAKTQIAISVAVEEVFVNIAHYAYPEGNGDVTVVFSFEPESRTATLEIRDHGLPFDPLKQKEPDITLSAEERGIGGLGIFITRKTMDSVSYRYENDENILTMRKTL